MNAQTVSFGEILKRERTNQGLSLRQLSEMSKIEASYINRLEKGNRDNPGFTTVCALSNALQLSKNEVLKSFGFDQLGTGEKEGIHEFESLITSYIMQKGDVIGFMPKIISMIEELRENYQAK